MPCRGSDASVRAAHPPWTCVIKTSLVECALYLLHLSEVSDQFQEHFHPCCSSQSRERETGREAQRETDREVVFRVKDFRSRGCLGFGPGTVFQHSLNYSRLRFQNHQHLLGFPGVILKNLMTYKPLLLRTVLLSSDIQAVARGNTLQGLAPERSHTATVIPRRGLL